MEIELRESRKDQAELNMIVDLERNDLGRICRIGSVRVTEPRIIEAHPLLGLGPEQVKMEVNPHFKDYFPAGTPWPLPEGWYGHLHNIYLQYAAERGIPALLILLWMLIMMLTDFWKALRRLPPGRSDRR